MYTIISAVIISMLMSGCVSTKNVPLNDAINSAMQGKRITTTKRTVPDFAAMTAGKAMFAMAGAVAMISAGNDIIKKNHVDDPADYINQTLMTDMKQKYSLSQAADHGVLVTDESPAKLASQYNAAEYLLDVRTINWGFSYYPTDWNNYRVMYSAKLRLIDTQTGKVLAESFCAHIPDKADNAPTYDQLLANSAQRLKDELRVAANFCVAEFKSESLKI